MKSAVAYNISSPNGMGKPSTNGTGASSCGLLSMVTLCIGINWIKKGHNRVTKIWKHKKKYRDECGSENPNAIVIVLCEG